MSTGRTDEFRREALRINEAEPGRLFLGAIGGLSPHASSNRIPFSHRGDLLKPGCPLVARPLLRGRPQCRE
jgi:hypothetical protein